MTMPDDLFTTVFSEDESCARGLDERDELLSLRGEFCIPPSPAAGAGPGDEAVYLTGNSLGCMPRRVRELMAEELDDWARLAVDGHLGARRPWFSYHEQVRDPLARLVGAKPGEVVAMNTLTVNLHLLMVSFYRPTRERYRIIVEDDCFPSDSYAVRSQAGLHAGSVGFDADDAIVRLRPREGEHALRTDDILSAIDEHRSSTALVMLGGVNYKTGQWFDMPRITRAAQEAGAVCGWDLAHAFGNVPVELHEWGVDFAAWCHYKYGNAGPGAVAGAFVHEKHARAFDVPRFAGWWGNDPKTRFAMGPAFVPRDGAEGWQISNPPVLSLTPVIASMELFERARMDRLRSKSVLLTGYLSYLIERVRERMSDGGGIEVITPEHGPGSLCGGEFGGRGCQLSIRVKRDAQGFQRALHSAGVVSDYREPDVIRVAPAPLYNSFHDVWRFGRVLAKHCGVEASSVQAGTVGRGG